MARDDVTIRFGAESSAVDKTLGSINKSVNRLRDSFGSLEGAMAAFATGSGVRNLIDLNAHFDELRTAVEFAGGDFEKLNEIATDNAMAIDQVSEAFVRLQNLRLDSSRRALEAYMNVAAGTPGKEMMDFVEAIPDAVMGEFERLKEFGIQARKEGEQIAITFRGHTEMITNDAAAIEEALIRIGEVEFAGAQAMRANTLAGAIDNLSSSFQQLFVSREAAQQTTEAVKSLTETLSDPAVIEGVNLFVSAIIKSVEGLTLLMGAAGSVVSDVRSAAAAMGGFSGMGREDLIAERNKLNEQLAESVVAHEEITEEIKNGSFWLKGELELHADIIRRTREQIRLITDRLAVLDQQAQTETQILDTKKAQTEEDRKSLQIARAKTAEAQALAFQLELDTFEIPDVLSQSSGRPGMQGPGAPPAGTPTSGITLGAAPAPGASIQGPRGAVPPGGSITRSAPMEADQVGAINNTISGSPVRLAPDMQALDQSIRDILSQSEYPVRVRPVVTDDSEGIQHLVDQVGGRD